MPPWTIFQVCDKKSLALTDSRLLYFLTDILSVIVFVVDIAKAEIIVSAFTRGDSVYTCRHFVRTVTFVEAV